MSHAFRKLSCTYLAIAAKQSAANLHRNDSLVVAFNEEVGKPKGAVGSAGAGAFSFIEDSSVRRLFSLLYYHMHSHRIHLTYAVA